MKRAFVEAWQTETAMASSVHATAEFLPMQAITLEWSGLTIEQKAWF